MKVHHLNCGTMRPFGRRLIHGEGPWFACGELVCHCLLIEGPHGLILVESGPGVVDHARTLEALPGWWRALCRPDFAAAAPARTQITALGLDPGDVRHVVLTHLDLDHAGGLRDFPDATVHVHRAEHVAATARGAHHRYQPGQWTAATRWALHEAGGDRWQGFEAVRPIHPDLDVVLVPLFGHSAGQCGVAVRAGDGWLLHAGDAVYHPAELAGRPAPLGLRVLERMTSVDRAARQANVERLAALHGDRAAGVDVFGAHDVQAYLRLSTLA